VTDAFAELGFERRPWTDPDRLQARYHELARLRHPDASGGDPAPLARLNESRSILIDPAVRIRHLLALEWPDAKCPEKFQPDFDLFSRIGHVTRRAEDLAEKQESARSPLAAAVVRAQAQTALNELAENAQTLDVRLRALEASLREIDSRWPQVAADELARMADEFAFLQKWRKSIAFARTRLLGG
jgi:DnaJ-domain-containing protein 1